MQKHVKSEAAGHTCACSHMSHVCADRKEGNTHRRKQRVVRGQHFRLFASASTPHSAGTVTPILETRKARPREFPMAL